MKTKNNRHMRIKKPMKVQARLLLLLVMVCFSSGAAWAAGTMCIGGECNLNGTPNIPFSFTVTTLAPAQAFGAIGLPAGLSINRNTGVISGTPTIATAGFHYYLKLFAIGTEGTLADQCVVFSVVATNKCLITSANKVMAIVGQPFVYTISALHNPTGFFVSGSLPSGLTYSPTTGVISGTPTKPGTYFVTLWAAVGAVSGMNPTVFQRDLTIIVQDAARALPLITSQISDVTVKAYLTFSTDPLFTYQIKALNSPTSFNATNLPSGLAVDKTTGLISGRTIIVHSPQVVTLTASNSAGMCTTTVNFVEIPSYAPMDAATKQGLVGRPFSFQLSGANGASLFGTMASDLTTPGLPSGLTCSASGLISGTPTAAGTWTILTWAEGNTPTLLEDFVGWAPLSLTITNNSGSGPIVTGVSPASGSSAGGTFVTISGTNFATSGTTVVKFGGVAATGVTVPDARTITCTAPASAAGIVNVMVANPDSQSFTLAPGFTNTLDYVLSFQTIKPEASGRGMDFMAGLGVPYEVDWKTNLVNDNWQFYTNLIGSGSSAHVCFTNATPQSFFRIRSNP
jgi:hypothetical protein